jgi:iron only hydrogenase large subunit-like protein/nitrogen-specific signal transduction histidine kinase
MGNLINNELVYTVKDRCRVCYTCVRECPVKAIKIINGQAEVILSRCIGCGNCTKVCSQQAKQYIDTTKNIFQYFESKQTVVAMVAPSFPAEFSEIDDYRLFIGMLRKLGFRYVVEVGFGADVVAREYEKVMDDEDAEKTISSDCPAIAYYVRHYHPELTDSLAPIVSPMVAMHRIVNKKYGEDLKTVFIGPCIAKKAESKEVDQVITFSELRAMFEKTGITANQIEPSDFDAPKAGRASIFPITRGKLNAMKKSDHICDENIIVASGRIHFKEAIKEFAEDLNKSQHLELLCCEGCIMGPGMTSKGKIFSKTASIRNYVRLKLQNLDREEWKKEFDTFKDLDYSQQFVPSDRRIETPAIDIITGVLEKMGKIQAEDHLNCGACGYDTCFEHAVAIVEGLAEIEMCLPYTIEKLHNSVKDLNLSNEKLASAQMSLKQSEKLANMGQLSAGIAHELNNPLGIITMYSGILKDEAPVDSPIHKDLELIVEQADRCKKIVGGLLNFARKNQVKLVETNIITFTHHSIDSIIVPENIKIDFHSDMTNPFAFIDNDQWMQVLTNIEKNAIEAMPDGGTLSVNLSESDGDVEFAIADTGVGISKENLDKIFTPFFTTKPIGKGTGLGLPLIYGIVKMHNGQVNVETNDDLSQGPTGTCFRIVIPRQRKV